jgi:NADPH-dependent 2,4-dienoyl-CoA reductase/sulfur reductase-like enzyme
VTIQEETMANRLLVVGGVAAGMSAAAKASRTDRSLQVVVYEKGPYISYAACGMPYFIAGDVSDYRDLIVRTPEQMAKQGVEVHVRHEVTAIDPAAQTVRVHDLARDREFEDHYDLLVIATGAHAVQPHLPGSDLRGVLEMRSLQSGQAAKGYMEERRPEKAVVVGGGYIGVEMAETFRRLGLEVTLLIRSGQVLRSSLDADMREVVHGELARQGVEIVQGVPLGFEGNGRVRAVATTAGTYPCDVAMVGIGARPTVELARQAGVALGPTGAIATDSTMHTNLPAIYAAGDCCEALHLVTGEPAYIPLGSTANKQGRTAGENAAGGQDTFDGIVGTMIVRCFDLGIASTGLTADDARLRGYDVRETKIQASDLSHYFPGAGDLHVKLIVDAQSQRLLGGQIVGPHRGVKRIDIIAIALHAGFTIGDLQRLDLAYAPPFSPVWDPVLVAANVAAR